MKIINKLMKSSGYLLITVSFNDSSNFDRDNLEWYPKLEEIEALIKAFYYRFPHKVKKWIEEAEKYIDKGEAE